MSDIRELIRRQIDLEDEGRAIGQSRYFSRELPWKTEAGSIEEEANLPPGKQLMKAIIAPMVSALEEFVAAACSGKAGRRHTAVDFVLLCGLDELAYLAARVVVNACAKTVLLQTAALNLTDAVIEHLEFKAFRDMNKVGYKGFLKAQAKKGYSRQRRSAVKKLFESEGCRITMPTNERITAGTKLVELLCESTGLFERDTVKRSKGTAYALRPTETLRKWLDEQHARCSVLEPLNLPMIVRPRRWRSPSYGGYLTPRAGNRLVKQRNQVYHEELRNLELPEVYDAVNHIQDTPWRINTRLLEVADELWKAGGGMGGLPSGVELPLPAKPEDLDSNPEALAAWKAEAASVYAANAAMVQDRLWIHRVFWIARRFAEEDRFYYPHELDFRGRVYPLPTGLPQPQGSDLEKALIQFADGVPLGPDGGKWIAIHLANLFGVDKVDFKDRIDWVAQHSDKLVACAEDPFENRFWTEADSPFCALAACYDWKGFLDEGEDYVSHIPVALDGSCSGLQHFSAMLRDRVGGSSVNLTYSPTPQDVYSRVAEACQVIADASDEEFARCWQGGKVTRKIAKRPTMTYCYSATRFGMQGMILQTLNELDREKGEPYLGGVDNYQAAMWLSRAMWEAISQVVVAASQAMAWLRGVANVAAKAGLPLWWTTPMGFPVLQEYKTTKGQRIEVHWSGQRVQLQINNESSSIDVRGMCNGVAPNFVHSMDAAHLMSVAVTCRKVGLTHLAVIHDSFGTHAGNTELLGRILRETFVEQYQGDVLRDFYEEIKDQLPEELAAQLPEPPEMGDLDINEVLHSSYVFA